MANIPFQTIENLSASARARYITLKASDKLELFSDWNPPLRDEQIPYENKLYCMAVIKLARDRNIPVKLMLVNSPDLNVVCFVNDRYILDLGRRDIPTKNFLEEFGQYRWLYISGFTKDDNWIKIIE